MHINLFLSLAFNNTSWLVWYKFVLFDVRQADMPVSQIAKTDILFTKD
jgi:hypothetical protein